MRSFSLSVAAAFVALTLGACDNAPDQPTEPAWPPPLDRQDSRTWFDRPINLDGVDPVWSGEIRRTTITVSPAGEPPLGFPHAAPAVTGGDAAYRTTAADGTVMELNLRSLWCAILPTDAVRPFTVELRLTPPGGETRTLRGCAAQTTYRYRADQPPAS